MHLAGWNARVATVLLALGLVGCDEATMRYRYTVSIELAGRIVADSAVQEIKATAAPQVLPHDRGFHSDIRGEGPVFNLADGSALFFLIAHGSYDWFILADCVLRGGGNAYEDVASVREFSGQCTIKRLPPILHMTSARDPTRGMRIVGPTEVPALLGLTGGTLTASIEATADDMAFEVPEMIEPWTRLQGDPKTFRVYDAEAEPRPWQIGGPQFYRYCFPREQCAAP